VNETRTETTGRTGSVWQAEDVPEFACYGAVGRDAGQHGVELGQRGVLFDRFRLAGQGAESAGPVLRERTGRPGQQPGQDHVQRSGEGAGVDECLNVRARLESAGVPGGDATLPESVSAGQGPPDVRAGALSPAPSRQCVRRP